MAVLTARALKERETPEFPIDIGGGDQVWARVPDIQLLVLQGIMPTPLLTGVVKLIGAWAGTTVTAITEDVIAASPDLLKFVDIMAAAALVRPRVVLREEDRLDDETLLASDLTVGTKKTILIAVTTHVAPPEVVAAATEFPGGAAREGTGPDVQEVSPASV